jgi:ComF family protein
MHPWLASLTEVANAAAGFFYPQWCQLCDQARATPAEGFVCAGCRAAVKWIEPPFCRRCGYPFPGEVTVEFECANCRGQDLHFSSARSAVAAREGVLDAIHRYKYQRALWFEPFLAGLLIDRAAPELGGGGWTLVVPVPLHPTKQREREFNQAERLGRRLASALRLPIAPRLLRRAKPTRTQTLLTREERQENVRGAFALRKPGTLAGQRIVLVDDVFTTGATTNACARVLRRAGADEVCVWTVARGI